MADREAVDRSGAKMPGISALDELVDDWDDLVSPTTNANTKANAYDVAGRRVLITASDRPLGEKVLRSLAHLRVDDHGPPSLEVIVCEGRQLGWDPYRMFGPATSPSGRAVVVRSSGSLCRFDPGDGILNVLDRTRRRAIFWAADQATLPYWEEHAPFRHIFGWWLEAAGFTVAHASGVGTPAGGAIVVGASGSGKSTVALSCLGSGLRCSGDDYQLLKTDGEPHTFSLYSCVKLEPNNVARFPRLAGSAEMVGGKARFFLNELWPDVLTRGFPIRAVLVPKVTGGTSRLVPISGGAALAALAPSSILMMHAVQGDPLGAMARIVSKANTFRLELGRDMQRLPSLVRQALE
jgi:hypothetical protein